MVLKWQGTVKTQGSHLVWMRIRLRNRYTLSMRCVSHKSDSYHQKKFQNTGWSVGGVEWFKEKPIRYSSQWRDLMTTSGRMTTFTIGIDCFQDTIMWTERCHPDVVRMTKFNGSPSSGCWIECFFTSAGKQHNSLKKLENTMDKTLESYNTHWRETLM
jgi:hypothetical protein